MNKKIGVKLLVCCFPESKGGTWNIPNFQHWKIPPDPLELLGFLVGFFFSRFQTLCRGGVHFFYAKSSFTSLHFPSLVRHLTPLISPIPLVQVTCLEVKERSHRRTSCANLWKATLDVLFDTPAMERGEECWVG